MVVSGATEVSPRIFIVITYLDLPNVEFRFPPPPFLLFG